MALTDEMREELGRLVRETRRTFYVTYPPDAHGYDEHTLSEAIAEAVWNKAVERLGNGVSADRIKDALFGNVVCLNFMRQQRYECFQMQGRYDGSISEECKEIFARDYQMWSDLLEEADRAAAQKTGGEA